MTATARPQPDWWSFSRFPFVRQAALAECGHACVAMLARFHGRNVELAELRAVQPVSSRGVTLATIITLGDKVGLVGRPLKVGLKSLRNVALPAIAHWDMNHFVVISKVGSRYLHIQDPALGFRKLSLSEASSHFTGVVLELQPSTSFARSGARARRPSFRSTLGEVRGHYRSLLQVVVLGAGLEACAIAGPFLTQWVLDRAVLSNNTELLTALALGFAIVAIFQAAFFALRSYIISSIGANFNYQWMRNLYGHLLELPVAFFEQRSLGSVSSRFSAVFTIQRTVNSAFTEALVDGVMVIGTMTLLFVYSVPLALLTIGTAALLGVLRLFLARPLREANHEMLIHQSRQQSSFLESIRGIQTIRLFAKERDRAVVWSNLLVDQLNADLKKQRLEIVGRAVTLVVSNLERIIVVWFAATLVMDKAFTVGMFLAFIAYREQFSNRVTALSDKVSELDMMKVHLERLADISLESKDDVKRSMMDSGLKPPSIELREVSISVAGEQSPLLRDVFMNIPSGACVAISGPSGAGKTTLARAICGLVKVSKGAILVDGVGLGPNEAVRSRTRVASAMQEDLLFAGSIAENISFFASEPDREKIEEVAKMASIHEDIVAMPMKYETIVGDLGASLSGGQRQRLYLARALYQDPAVLVLDEATSNLDGESERRINDTLRGMSLTRIVIAHRRETLDLADYLYMVKDHRVTLVRSRDAESS